MKQRKNIDVENVVFLKENIMKMAVTWQCAQNVEDN